MIEIEITDEMRSYAHSKAKEMGTLRNSITRGQGNVAGFLGEKMVADYFKCNTANTYEYDIISNNGVKLEVKTKRTSVTPKDTYDVSIANFNTRQKCDYYVFCRVLDDQSKGWILGYDNPEYYKKTSRFLKKGTVDPDNNFTVRADCYNKAIKNLQEPKKLLDIVVGDDYSPQCSNTQSETK